MTWAYEVMEGIEAFLDETSIDCFLNIKGNPSDMIEDEKENRSYCIEIVYETGEKRGVSGSFDRYGLPEDWPEFIQRLMEFMLFYGTGELFDEYQYSKPKRRLSDCVFCHVCFEDGGPTYTYLADEDIYEAGDLVVVPVGTNNRETTAIVESVEYRQIDQAPYPMEKIKRVIQKYEKQNDRQNE